MAKQSRNWSLLSEGYRFGKGWWDTPLTVADGVHMFQGSAGDIQRKGMLYQSLSRDNATWWFVRRVWWLKLGGTKDASRLSGQLA